jgi:phenylalanine-4-hydroxylase
MTGFFYLKKMETETQQIGARHYTVEKNLNALSQNYAAYKAEDLKVWGILFERQMQQLKEYAIQAFLDCVDQIGFNKNEIPNFEKLNQGVLKDHGWEIEVVKGIIPVADFFRLLNQKKFPCSAWIRPMSSLDYLEEPDLFHDVFGHLPLLLNPTYNRFFEWIATKAMAQLEDEHTMTALQRLYWYTIEFGLCYENGQIKVYGAGLLSSIGETKFALGEIPKKIKYNRHAVLESPFHTDRYQDQYFVIQHLSELLDALDK